MHSVPTVNSFLTEQATTHIPAQDALHRAQGHQEEQADKRRRDHSYEIGDQVLVDATNLTSPADSTIPGPFTLLKQNLPFTFCVEFRPFYKLHNGFHDDTLRPYLPSPESLDSRKQHHRTQL
ncbi:hypothetical protein EMPS_07800 [Entomortierella parvispora]|uniref:Uncharacterized protein n=1 Tax=Entomortierella parvispora TaxID=205924 RepID=A0A9P3LYS4_9FUNG|nr:hypothetical protein EMPS_07800 [Entomortierella parvispora]